MTSFDKDKEFEMPNKGKYDMPIAITIKLSFDKIKKYVRKISRINRRTS